MTTTTDGRGAARRIDLLPGSSASTEDAGASSVEYAMLASLIAATVAATIGVLGTTLAGLFIVSWP